MAYTKNPTWVDGEGGGTRIDASKLNAIEDGIFNAAAVADGAIPKSLADAKGDLLVGSANDTIVRKAVGANGQILMADSNATDGLTWQAPIPVLRNLLANSDFSNGTTGWNGSANAGFAVSGGRGGITPTAGTVNYGYQAVSVSAGSKYYIAAAVIQASTHASISFGFTTSTSPLVMVVNGAAGATMRPSMIVTATSTLSANLAILDYRTSGWDKTEFDNVLCIDLTAAFGAGNEPTKAEMDAYMARYPNSWFADTTPQLWSGADWLKRTQNACGNLGRNGDFSNGTSQWSAQAGASISAASNELTMIATAAGGYVYQTPTGGTIPGSTYYIAATVKATSATPTILLALAGTGATHTGGGAYERLSFTKTASSTTHAISVVDNSPSGWGNVLVKWVVVIDLTKTFGAGNEPTKTEMDYLLSFYPNSWFNGTVNDLVTRRNIRDRIGSGSPEGVVTAPVGTSWTDILDTCGATKWIKKTGTGNTGWEPTVLNTGWRTVTSAGWLVNGWTATAMYVQRVGQDVVLQIEGLNASSMTSDTFIALPTGFTMQNSLDRRHLLHSAAYPAVTYRTVGSTIPGATTGTPLLYGEIRFRTLAGVVPAALPGTAF